MAGEQTQTGGETAAEVKSPLSSQAQSQSTSGETASQTGGSEKTQSSQDGTTQQVSRPEGLPDSYWDAEKNTLKVDPTALIKDLKERDELKTFKAAEDVKALSRPQKPDDYKVALPADFKQPVGSEFKFDEKDPIIPQARAWAHAAGLTQEQFGQGLALVAASRIADEAQIATARTAEQGKLGANAGARVDAVLNFMKGVDATPNKRDAAALAAGLVTAGQVEAWERLITRITSQGSASFSQQHRVAADTDKIPNFEKMSFAEQRQAQDQLRARKTA